MSEQATEEPKQPRLIPSPISGVVPPVEHRFKPGHSGNPKGRPILSVLERRLRDEKAREEKIAALWLEDAQNEEDPMVRRFARNDLLDRLVGKPAQSVQVTVEELSEVEWGEESP